MLRKLSLLVFVAMFGLAGCEDKGPAEEAGEAIDEAVEDTAEAVEEACEDATNEDCGQ